MVTKEVVLGSNELKLLFTLEEKDKKIFTSNEAHSILGNSDSAVKNVLYRLRNKGRIEKIEKGKYLLIPAKAGYNGSWSEIPYLVAQYLIEPYYIGFWSALNYWGMTEQTPRTVFVATIKRKRDLIYGSTRFEFVTLSENRFFGFVEQEISEGKFKVSSKEKTVLDCLAYPRYCGGLEEVVKGIWNARNELDFREMVNLGNRFRVSVVTRRLGYILENVLDIEKETRSKIIATKFSGYRWLDPLASKKSEKPKYSTKYGLILNRMPDELTNWMGH
jgi:predicted transcriptional regulator of viral defense system